MNKKTLVINANLALKGKGVRDKTDTKTSNFERIIMHDDDLVKMLKKHYENQKKISNFNEDMYVFGSALFTSNHYLGYTTIASHLDQDIKKANVKKITLHGFRHSHVSLLVDLGCEMSEVADRLGDTISVIERTYYHMFPLKKLNVINKLNEFKKNTKK